MFKLKLTPLENQLRYIAIDIQEEKFNISFNGIIFSNEFIVGCPYIHIKEHHHTISFDDLTEARDYLNKVLTSGKELGGYVTITGSTYTLHM